MVANGMLLLAVGLLVAADDRRGDDRGAQALQGRWTVVSGEEGGKRQTDADVKDASVVFQGNRVRVKMKGEELEMTYTLRQTEGKKGRGEIDKGRGEIDFTLTRGPDKGKTSKGIYSLEGDSLRVAYAAPGEDRPRDFRTAEGTRQAMWVLKRAQGGDREEK